MLTLVKPACSYLLMETYFMQLFAYDMVNKYLTRPGEELQIPIPASSIAGAVAGFSSTLCTYPLELLKTRLTVQVNLITALRKRKD